MLPELFRIPPFGPFSEPFVLHPYGLLIVLGFICVTLMIGRQAKRFGEADPEAFVDLAFYFLLMGLLGSRLLFIAVNWRDYAAHPIEIFYVWKGGLVFYGGFILAFFYGIYWAYRRQISFFKIADYMIPMVAFNHAWGRLGCLSAGCCHGKTTDSILGIVFPLESGVQALQQSQGLIGYSSMPLPVHATQIYEALGEVLLFLLLVLMRSKKRFHGQLVLIWLSLYPILRSVVEIYRGDTERGFVIPDVLSTSQFISIFVALTAVILLIYLRRQKNYLTK